MMIQQPGGKYVMSARFGQDPTTGQRFGQELGGRDWNKPNRQRWNPVLSTFSFPCWIDRAGLGFLQPLTKAGIRSAGKAVASFMGPVLIYPMDRTSEAFFATPLDKLTVVDLVRMTLGVGPCQFILDLEGQKSGSEGVATCYASDVINAIYKHGTQLQQGPAIQEHLAKAVAFIRNVRERIDQYVRFGEEIAKYLEAQKGLQPSQAGVLDDWLLITRRLQLSPANLATIHTPDFAQQTAEDFQRDLLTYIGQGAAEKCAARMGIFTSIGGAQDGLVANCRTVVKSLRQRAGIALTMNPESRTVAMEVRARTQAILRKPIPYEAPRH
jgi:hypothetical protein